ncbi:MAG: hypothetical protein BGO25_11990 [Acidobacteriales bacterium 59-55]|nr:TonB-dependent receptor [Terriglobales bacterium]OJV43864.1 MAG: hypothetical protein BGO25_11990 [Acidobacteriales bacterium 59-55]
MDLYSYVTWRVTSKKKLSAAFSQPAALFQADTENVRITQADGSIASVGKRRNRGLDIGITGYVNRKWQVFGGYTFMNAILVEAGGSGAAAGLLNGRSFPNTPEHSFSLTSYYSVTRKLNLGGGIYAAGKVFGNNSPTTPKWVPAYARVDIYGAYSINSHLELQATSRTSAARHTPCRLTPRTLLSWPRGDRAG